MKIWIVGAKGLLGNSLQQLCKKENISFYATGKEVSITSLEALQNCAEEYEPTHIVNCAAFTDVDGAENAHEEAFAVNALGAESLGVVARECGARLVHISTDYVFSGCSGTTPFSETDLCQPRGVYALSKREGEIRLMEEFPLACIIRTSWIFGKKGKNFISSLFGKLQTNEWIQAVDDQLGRATFCKDLSEAILSLICHSGIYHFANEGITSRYQIALDMHRLASTKGKIMNCKEIVPVKASSFPAIAFRPSFSALSTKKIEGILGKKPRSINTALSEFLNDVVQ